jgi:hypothetical protein
MPYWMDAQVVGATTTFFWDPSVDLQGDAVHYELYFANDPALLPQTPSDAVDAGVTHHTVNIAAGIYPSYAISTPAVGDWYLKIFAIDESAPSERWQIAFDSYWDQANDLLYHGVRRFIVN